MILWLHGQAAHDARFFAAVRGLGFNAVSITGGQDPAKPGRHGLRFYRDQLCGKGVFELRDRQIDPVRAAYVADRDEALLIRPTCLSSTETLAGLAAKASEGLAAALPHDPIAVSLGDEASVTSHANPLDLCFAEPSLDLFRAALATRHGSIDALNAAWETGYESFDALRPMTADRIRERELGSGRIPGNLAPWADHREFMDVEFARLVRRMVEQVGREAPGLPCGLTGLQQPSAYGGHDYARLMAGQSFFEAYDIGGARDLAMCMARPDALQAATLFPPQGPADLELVLPRIGDMLAHGMWGTIVWSAQEVFDERLEPSPYGREIARAVRRLRPAMSAFAGARLRRSPVWLIESQASVRAWWMLDSRDDGPTWIERLTSYEAAHSTSIAARHSWIRILEDLGLQPRLVAASGLPALLEKEAPALLVLPATIALGSDAARAIGRYVEGGGHVVADHSTAIYDERLRRRTSAALDGLFGLTGRSLALDDLLVHQGKVDGAARLRHGAAAAERRIRGPAAEPDSGFHVQIEREVGRGRAHYLNIAVCEYGAVRLDPGRLGTALDLRRRLRFVLRSAGVEPPVVLRAEEMPTCLERMVLDGRKGECLLAVRVNALEAPDILRKIQEKGVRQLELRFHRPVALKDLLTGATFAASDRHVLSLVPTVGVFAEVLEPR